MRRSGVRCCGAAGVAVWLRFYTAAALRHSGKLCGGRLLTVQRDLCRGAERLCEAEHGFARRKFNLEENNFIIHNDAAGGSAPRRIFLGYAD